MHPFSSEPFIFAAWALLALLIFFTYVRGRSGATQALPLPPGPKPVALLGNVHQIPLEYQHRTFDRWSKQYGDIYSLRIFRKPVIVLSSAQAVHDLIEKRSSKYSDRPQFTMFTELMGWYPNLSLLPYGDQWRLHRKWFQDAFISTSVLDTYRDIQQKEANNLLANILDNPDAFMSHVDRYLGALVLEVVYGQTSTSLDDDLIHMVEKASRGTSAAGGPAATLVDFIPILRHIPAWMPGAGFKRKANEVRSLVRDVHEIPFGFVQRAMAMGTAKPSFLSSLLEGVGNEETLSQDMKENMMGAAATVYATATETTSSAIVTFILAMVLNPDVLEKAQAEMDRTVGSARLPELEDRDSLPYLEAIIQEVYRFNPPTPLGLPHQSTEEDEYRGYHIPKGAMIFTNIWTMTRDSKLFPDPEVFRPERYLRSEMRNNAEIGDPRSIVFGFGRRICPGRKFGDLSVWLAAASLVWAFDIRKARDSFGQEITPTSIPQSGTVSNFAPFQCCVRPRTQQKASVISRLRGDRSA
ncbi:cytochrome P450 [Wolfiporia cocos MD-104 SS10]|uniref:Cytochrome P450 n=1 Tax=Wolfiporia cocos (strain MD-104) TaxID=742152 RepID=A0A2H3K688_WOLCO|nr:cytochrome P450 [Wolfiporia cocos MD-104 SS10]